MVLTYNLIHAIQSVNIGYCPYLNFYHNDHNESYRLNQQHHHYYILLWPHILGKTAVGIFYAIGMPNMDISEQRLLTWRFKIFFLSPFRTFIFHLYRRFLDNITVIIVTFLTNGLIIPVSVILNKVLPLSPSFNPIPYNQLLLIILVSLNICHFCSFDHP